ncbi:MAG: DUF4838 domain-containing protein [Clostridia bacterium]|nr:DUF4838 domain-containing protein [Clostridia bacterium]
MKNINIVLEYENAENTAHTWANEERFINFRTEPERAARCTASFAATELLSYLGRTLTDCSVCVSSQIRGGDINILLTVESASEKGSSYALIPTDNGLQIKGRGRAGVLYGAYELLKMQGWRWIEPMDVGEVEPPKKENIALPTEPMLFETTMPNGRGFEFEGGSKESHALLLWMARNRLNLAGYRPATAPLANKLCMSQKSGGHIFEAMLSPERKMPSGKTLFDEHPEWYGTPKNGEKTRGDALKTQFCVTQPALVEFLGEELLSRIMGEWYGADRIDVWGFDTWGGVCSCDECEKLGNTTDRTLYFIGQLREFLNRARGEGRLDHDVSLITTVYEGTSTMTPPTRKIPAALSGSGDMILFSPILRCYQHSFFEPDCSYNKGYADALRGWAKTADELPIIFLEYYNVSKFEDLPLLFSSVMSRDIPDYVNAGVRALSYMHLPMLAWGVRALTQNLYAELAWNKNADTEAIIADYFDKRYGRYADEMKKAYSLIEVAFSLISSYRSWSGRDVLTHLFLWDVDENPTPIEVDDHIKNTENLDRCLSDTVKGLSDALKIINSVMMDMKADSAEKTLPPQKGIVNPAQLAGVKNVAKDEDMLADDKKMLIYGINSMSLMLALTRYRRALVAGDSETTEREWEKIETLEAKMEERYLPLGFFFPNTGMICRDELTRTQLKDTIRRIRKSRK